MALGAIESEELARIMIAERSKDMHAQIAYQRRTIEEAFMVPFWPPRNDLADALCYAFSNSFSMPAVQKARKPWFIPRRGWWGWYIYPHILAALVAASAWDAFRGVLWP